jgi:hypothetical protein
VRKSAIVLTTAGALAVGGISSPGPAEARGGFRPALAGGLIAGAIIGGLASSAYAWGPGYGYPGYGYYGGYARGYNSGCPQPGYGEYYNCGAYAMPGYGGPAHYGYRYGPW